jgi:DUF2971 family protein
MADQKIVALLSENDRQTLFGRIIASGEGTPPILYHYTKMQTLLAIVDTGRIRATHVRYLNDRSETSTMWDLVLARLERRRSSAQSESEKLLLAAVIDLARNRKRHNEFVASFSEKGDDLGQWRSYCPAGGVSVGFSSAALRSNWISNPRADKPAFVGTFLYRITYLDRESPSHLDPVIDDVMNIASGLRGKTGFSGQKIQKEQAATAAFSVFSSTFKDSAFRSENEWRIIANKPHKPMPGQQFRSGKSTLVPYIEVELNRDLNYDLLPEFMIRKVVIGPTPNPELSFEALQNLFLSVNHPEVLVENSVVPYRDW